MRDDGAIGRHKDRMQAWASLLGQVGSGGVSGGGGRGGGFRGWWLGLGEGEGWGLLDAVGA